MRRRLTIINTNELTKPSSNLPCDWCYLCCCFLSPTSHYFSSRENALTFTMESTSARDVLFSLVWLLLLLTSSCSPSSSSWYRLNLIKFEWSNTTDVNRSVTDKIRWGGITGCFWECHSRCFWNTSRLLLDFFMINVMRMLQLSLSAVSLKNVMQMETQSFLEKETNGQAGGGSIDSTSIQDVKRIFQQTKYQRRQWTDKWIE